MSRNLRISLTLAIVVVIGIVVALVASGSSDDANGETAAATSTAAAETAAPVIRPDTHRLSTAPEGSPTLVEFLDFECESCRALFPYIEQLRRQYDGRVTFAIRYFPIPSHRNAELAARAVEAAAQQGELEAMYRTMYETQAEWGESQEPRRDTFLGFARRLGLDMDRFTADLDDPRTAARVARDQQDGVALGVQGTPTLFLDGELLELTSVEQLEADIAAALAR